jgi:hypothetical protein
MTVVVTVGSAPGVAAGVVVVSVIGVPFLRPVTTVVESEPRNELKVPLILPVTFVSLWLAAKLFMRDASLLSAEAVSANAWGFSASAKADTANMALIFIGCFPPLI